MYQVIQVLHVTATGGTITTSGDFKIHTFTGDGSFVVSNAGTPLGGTDKVSYMVVAGGGGGGGENAKTTSSGGGGGGGFREGKVASDPYTASPLAATPCSGFTITGTTTYPITVGGGGTAGPSTAPNDGDGFWTVHSHRWWNGSGKSGTGAPARAGPGGSGGGAAQCNAGGPTGTGSGAGNDPPVAPPQGNPGGKSTLRDQLIEQVVEVGLLRLVEIQHAVLLQQVQVELEPLQVLTQLQQLLLEVEVLVHQLIQVKLVLQVQVEQVEVEQERQVQVQVEQQEQ